MSQIDLPASEMLSGIPVMVRVAETQSFSEAARQLGISPSGVSKAISRLEERLGVRLFDRTTRRVAATEEGLRFYERCRLIVSDLEEAQAELMEASTEPRGTVLATVPTDLGQRLLVPALPGFLRDNPELEVRLEFNDRRVDLIGERIDLAVRMGEPPTNSRGRLVRRPVAQSHAVICASPDYLRNNKRIRKPEDVQRHNVYVYGSHRSAPAQTWTFKRGDERRAVEVHGNATVDSGDALVALACAGDGLIAVFDFLAATALRSGALQRVLPTWQIWEPLQISLVYPKHRRLSPKVMAFATFVEDTLAASLQR